MIQTVVSELRAGRLLIPGRKQRAFGGYRMTREPCAKFNLFGNCPTGEFCKDSNTFLTYQALVEEQVLIHHVGGNHFPTL